MGEATSERDDDGADWQRRVVSRSLRTAAERSVDRGLSLINAAATVLERANGEDITVQDVADEAGQSLRTLYQYFESKDDLLLAVFEEAMRTYATLIARAVADLADPLERLAGVMVAAVRMSELSSTGLDRGLARLRLRLSEAAPERVARAQAAMAALVREAVDAAAADGAIEAPDPDAAAFMLLSLNGAYITAGTLGNDAGVPRPEVAPLVLFCLRGLGAKVDDAWVSQVAERLRMPGPRRRASGVGGRAGTGKKAAAGTKAAGAKKASKRTGKAAGGT